MSHPATRVLSVLELLQTHGRMSGRELAERLEVDVRTLRRYIAVLEELGIPITAERGRHGAYLLVAGFKLPPMMFTDDEVLALAVGLLAARGLGLAGAAPAVESARAKLERVMPANLKRRVRAVTETVDLDLTRAVPAGDNAALLALSTAARERRQVRLAYRSPAGERTERTFDPYGLAFRRGCWYGVGHCHLRGGLRTFRLDRVEAVEPLATAFERPEAFDVPRHLARGIATLPRTFSIEVMLHADLDQVEEELFAVGVYEPTAGGVLLRGTADDLDWFARQLARLPFPFDIRRPPELRQALRACAERLAGMAGG